MASHATHGAGFTVEATKKGALPIKVESRAKGKKVTIISGVRGNAQLLCSTLSTLLGIGGTVHNEAGQQVIQVQGSQADRVAEALGKLNCLKGVKVDQPKKPAKQAEVATRHCGYDKFLRQDKPDLAKLLQGEAYAPQCPPGAECFRWHGYWVYCRGCCEQIDHDDVWEESAAWYDPCDYDLPSHQPSQPSWLPRTCGSRSELDVRLRKLGMLAEVGEAAVTWGLRLLGPAGSTLAEYRRKAIAPGAWLIQAETKGKRARSARNEGGAMKPKDATEARQRIRAMPKLKSPPKLGSFSCPVCHNNFGLYKTLKQHMLLSHNTTPPPKLSMVEAATAAAVQRPSGPSATRTWPRRPVQVAVPKKKVKEDKYEEAFDDWEPFEDTPGTMAMVAADWMLPQLETGEVEREAEWFFEDTQGTVATVAADWMLPQLETREVEEAELYEDCPICQERIKLKDLPSHVEACLANPLATESWKACPLCQEKFHPDAIDAHVQACLERDENESDVEESEAEEAEDSDGFYGHQIDPSMLESYPVLTVDRGFVPQGPDQLKVMEGDLFLRMWEQPKEEGGYWAWGILVKQEFNGLAYVALQDGYVPLSHLNGSEPSPPEQESPEEPKITRRWGRRTLEP
ncbi:Uncharacterized protein SCF082_LOCUS46375 [Durusdinium trenchii]|uniref:Uncharacterized protein n=1 Tax=Durusdinium trenchii TaxID=1381693 RepID=A0ABP0REE9_9DINO